MNPMNRNISRGVVALLIVCFLGTSLIIDIITIKLQVVISLC